MESTYWRSISPLSFPLPGMCPSPPPRTRCDHKNLLSSNLVPLSKTRAPKNPPLARLPPEMCPYTVVRNRMSGFCMQYIWYKVCARDYDILTHLYFWNNVLGLSQIVWHWWKPVSLPVASNNLFSVSRRGNGTVGAYGPWTSHVNKNAKPNTNSQIPRFKVFINLWPLAHKIVYLLCSICVSEKNANI